MHCCSAEREDDGALKCLAPNMCVLYCSHIFIKYTLTLTLTLTLTYPSYYLGVVFPNHI